MTWRATLVAPVDATTALVVQVSCRWCPWRSELVDVTEEAGRVTVRLLRKAHDCRTDAPQVAALIDAPGVNPGWLELAGAVKAVPDGPAR